MKVLGLIPRDTGSTYYRLQMPLEHLAQHYDVDYAKIPQLNGVDYNILAQFDVVYMCREFPHYNDIRNIPLIAEQLHSLGCKIVLDIDDYWRLSARHILNKQYHIFGVTEKILESIRCADHVTTTSELLARRISPYNQNVTVLPNAIYKIYPQFTRREVLAGHYRFGYMAGICHMEDVDLMREGFAMLHSENSLKGKYNVKLFGYNETEGEYRRFEDVFTNRGKCDVMAYTRVEAKSVFTYAEGYNEIDCALIPLNNNTFNQCKSELKMIEAGVMGKAAIVSNIYPYTNIIKDGENCIAIHGKKGSAGQREWFEAMRKLINEPDYAKYLADNLSRDIEANYNLEQINVKRYELLKQYARP